MGKNITLKDLFGLVKDKVSLSKAALLSKPSAAAIQVAVVRATAHSPPAPPDDRHVSALLLFGEASRSTASPIITALMDRLHRTGNCVVALKCLLIIHTIIRRGPFILQDQLSIFPATGGHNYLKLSDFRDHATATTWALSSWVRWYARFLETLLSSSRVLGYFLCSSSCGMVRENKEHRISSFLNVDLFKELDSLFVLIEEICKVPDNLAAEGDVLVKEIMGLLLGDYVSAVNEILLRLGEFNERLGLLSFDDSVELVCGLKRLQDCRARMSVLCAVNKPSIEMMWGSVQDLKDQIGMLNGGGKFLTWETRGIGTESARFEYRVRGDSVRFQSGRLSVNSVPSFLALDKSI